MAECSECGKSVSMPFTCKFCGDSFCSSHRLPENHECGGLEEYRADAKKEDNEITYDIQRKQQEYQQQNASKGSAFKAIKRKAQSWKRKFKRKLSDSSRPVQPRRQQSMRQSPMGGAVRQAFPEIGTFMLLGSILVVFILQVIVGRITALTEFGLVPALVFSEPWRVVTSMFMHSGSAHLLLNSMVLFFFGAELERRVGTTKFFKLYAIAGVVAAAGYAGFAHLTGNVMVPAVGASGALYGVFAAIAMIAPEIRVLALFVFPMKIRTALVGFALLDIFLLTQAVPIASAAHLSGLVVGLYFGYRWKGRQKKQFDMFSL